MTKFHKFSSKTENETPPEYFSFPYYYKPHPLACLAMDELQKQLEAQKEWMKTFNQQGVMFGALVVRNRQGELGYLLSFSGQHLPISPSSLDEMFVEPIAISHQDKTQMVQLQQAITEQEKQILALENDHHFIQIKAQLQQQQKKSEQEINAFQQQMVKGREKRKLLRQQLETSNSELSNNTKLRELAKQSSQEKRELKQRKQQWQRVLDKLTREHHIQQTQLALLQQQKQQLNQQLTTTKLRAYQLINQHGERKSIYQLLNLDHPSPECKESSTLAIEENLPKLLQAAFSRQLTPIALAECWWGASPYHKIRQHKNLYPVNQTLCFEIIAHQLKGIKTEPNPLIINPAKDKELEIIYNDEAMVIVNKPAEFLSVPGKSITDSVYSRIKALYPNATGPLIVHRLDMSTSGLLVLALTSEANKQLQKQFIERTVLKRYTALLEGELSSEQGEINLPLRGDIDDRPHQMVCHQYGKPSKTHYEVIERYNQRTKVYLYPHTGRTHQLRVHCAHQAGLNMPIVGDDLYGFKEKRLHLHAGYLKLRHPITQEELEFCVEAEF